ncbi:hypothetical protein NXS19_002380 [Fusarium pseudograminearum]|nr:hypothetical protein NXS19_002380 [Fusarium pseudograminearum]
MGLVWSSFHVDALKPPSSCLPDSSSRQAKTWPGQVRSGQIRSGQQQTTKRPGRPGAGLGPGPPTIATSHIASCAGVRHLSRHIDPKRMVLHITLITHAVGLGWAGMGWGLESHLTQGGWDYCGLIDARRGEKNEYNQLKRIIH